MSVSRRRYLNLSVAFFLISALVAAIFPTAAHAADLVPNPAAEQYILEMARGYYIADLADKFPNEADRVISGEFVTDLFRGKDTSLRGVYIVNATVSGYVYAPNSRAEYPISFNKSTFKDYVYVGNSSFKSSIEFNETTFDQYVSFAGSSFTQDFYFQKNTVSDYVGFSAANFSKSAYFDQSTYNRIYLVNADIEKDLDISNSTFSDAAYFSSAHISRSLFASNTTFSKEADFDLVTVAENAFFDQVTFDSTANFSGIAVAASLDFSKSKFTDSTVQVDMSDIAVKRYLKILDATFTGGLSLANSNIWQLVIKRTVFSSTEMKVVFGGVDMVEGYFFDCEFDGPVDFIDLSAQDVLEIKNIKFIHDSEIGITDGRITSLSLDNSQFAGTLNMNGTNIGQSLSLDNAQLNNSTQAANFDYLAVGAQLSMKDTTILGPLSMRYLEAGHLFISPKPGASISLLDLAQAKVSGEMLLSNLAVDNLNADSLAVAGPLKVQDLSIAKSADLRNSNFTYVDLQAITFPPTSQSLTLDSMNYTFLRVTLKEKQDEKDIWKNSLAFINNANFSLDVYKKLESFFMEQGEIEAGNAVFVAMRDRQAEQYTWLQPQRWWYFFLKVFILYGRGPQIAALWSALFVAAGALVFRKKAGMDTADLTDAAARFYNPIWYSFDAFMPYIDLSMNTVWRPKPERRFANTYLRFHSIMGWVLIPIALLAIGGVI